LTTSALEKRTGVSRTTIYFYIRRGLLPAPQRTPTGRSLYSEDHVTLLRKIGELKRDGRSLEDIKRALENDLVRAGEREMDLPAMESDRVREAIIRVATEEFAAKGYKGTHVLAIIQELGINPHIFYRHFPSKLELLAECFKNAAPLPIDAERPPKDASGDPAENVLRGLTRDVVWHRLSAVLAGAIRSEGLHERPAQYRLAETWDAIIVNIL
jgi:DNA-binding transcriptional MerR regulator